MIEPYRPGIPSGLHRRLMRDDWSPLVDETFGEWVTLKPMRRASANVMQEPDQSRPVVRVAGVFRAPAEPATYTDSHAPYRAAHASTGSPTTILQKPTFSFAVDGLPWPIRRGDLIVRDVNGRQYEAQAPRLDGLHIRVVVPVVELGVGAPAGISSDL